MSKVTTNADSPGKRNKYSKHGGTSATGSEHSNTFALLSAGKSGQTSQHGSNNLASRRNTLTMRETQAKTLGQKMRL